LRDAGGLVAVYHQVYVDFCLTVPIVSIAGMRNTRERYKTAVWDAQGRRIGLSGVGMQMNAQRKIVGFKPGDALFDHGFIVHR
jgi:hypothetical protein